MVVNHAERQVNVPVCVMLQLKEEAVTTYRFPRQSSQAIVTLNGPDFLLGPHNIDASRTEYRRRIAEWLAKKMGINHMMVHNSETAERRVNAAEFSISGTAR